MRTRSLALGVVLALGISAGAADAQSIAGVLRDAATGNPLGNPISEAFYGVTVYGAEGQVVATAYTSFEGGYSVNVPAGTYFVKAFGQLTSHLSEVYDNFPCVAADCVVTSGTPVAVASGTTIVDFVLQSGSGTRVTGTVRQSSDGSPLGGVPIRLYSASGSLVTPTFTVSSGVSASDGTYTIDGLAAGTYFARTAAVSFGTIGSPNVVDELFGGLPCPTISALSLGCRVTDGTPVVVTVGATTTGVDFSLEPGGGISGVVTDASGQPINLARVTAYVGDRAVGAGESASGMYVITGLPPGTYSVRAEHYTGLYRREWYDDKCFACGDRPTPVTVTAGATRTGINFSLAAGGSIEGTVTFTPPSNVLVSPPLIFVYNAAGILVETRSLGDGNGTGSYPYTVAGLPPGTYYVKAWDSAFPATSIPVPPRVVPAKGRLVGELFNNIVCVAADCRPTSGTPVQVTSGQATRGVDFALELGGTITGAGIGPGRGVEVFDGRGVLLPERLEWFGIAVVGLPPGTYYLRRKRDPLSAEQLYRNITGCLGCPPTFGTPVIVGRGQDVTGIDFTNEPGRAIAGTIRDASTLVPLSNVSVEAYAADGRLIGSALSSFGGTYRMSLMGPGNYYLRTINARNYVDEVYPDVVCSQCPATLGTPVPVTATADTTGIDFSLASGASLGGVVTSSDGFWLPGSAVSLFDASGVLSARAKVSGLGQYSTTLPPGAYRARVDEIPGYIQELFDNLPCAQGACDVTTGTPIALAALPIANIDFSLAACVAPSIAPLRLATGAVGIPYRQTFSAMGGTPPRQFHVASGMLPAGLSLDSASGVLSGTPTASGSYAVTISVVDGGACAGARDYVIDVHPCAFALDRDSASVRASGEPWLVRVTAPCGVWTATTDAPWVTVLVVAEVQSVILSAAPNPGPGARQASIVIGPRVFTLRQSAPEVTPPFGFMDVPLDGAVVDGSLAVGGWALDDLGVFEVRVYRNSVSPEPPGARVFLGVAVFVDGARPDIEALYPTYPNARRAGWGFMLLTNMLPQQGNGVFQISAYAVDADLTESFLGQRTIVVNNATAILPFGAIDTPRQGETVSGANYVNFGWALTPQPKSIPIDGSTIHVYVDGVQLGTVNYNFGRADIATLFPGYANSSGPVGYRLIDTTALDEGLHTIAWTVADSLGAAAGIGSRYFRVSNSALGTSSFASGVSAALRAQVGRATASVPARVDGIDVGRRSASLDLLPLGEGGERVLALSPLDRLVLTLEPSVHDGCKASWSGYHVAGGETQTLPAGSSLDAAGTFYWQPGPAFAGSYQLVFVRTACDGERRRVPLRATVR